MNDVTIAGNGDGKVYFKLPEQAEGKSRHFMIRLEEPAKCAYDFVEGGSNASVMLQSSYGKLLSVDNSMASSITVFDCFEVAQKPTKLFVDVHSSLSTLILQRESDI